MSKRIIFTKDATLTLKRFAKVEGQAEKIATLQGYALLWNVISSDRGGYKVRLLPNSATFTDPCLAYWHHDASKPIGNTANGTLRLFPDDKGVRVEIDLPDTTTGRDAEELVENKYVTGMSFAMVDSPTYHITQEDGQSIVNAESYMVDEVTITAIPSFVETTISVKEDDVPEDAEQPMQLSRGPQPLPRKEKNVDTKERNRQKLKLSKYKLSMLNLD